MEFAYPTDVHEWNWETVQNLQGQSETQYLEYKRTIHPNDDDSRDDWNRSLEREITAFANASGGILVFGVDDDASPAPFELPDHEVKQSVTSLIQNTTPVPDITIPEPIQTPSDSTNRIILPIAVEEATRKPILTKDSAIYIRINDRKEPMSREQMQSLFISEDRRQQEIRKLESEIERFYSIIQEDDYLFPHMAEVRPPNYGALNLAPLKNALRENTALYGKSDVSDEITYVFNSIWNIENAETMFGREANGYVPHRFASKEKHWKSSRSHLRRLINELHWKLKSLIEAADLSVKYPDKIDLPSR